MPRNSRTGNGSRITLNKKNLCKHCGSSTKHRTYCKYKPAGFVMQTVVHNDNIDPNALQNAFATAPNSNGNSNIEVDIAINDMDKNEPLLNEEEQQTSARIINFLQETWMTRKKTLPTIYKFKYINDATLNSQLWPTNEYLTPNPLMHSMPEVLPSTKVVVICPYTFYPALMHNFKVKCPACNETGVTLNGWAKGFRVIPTLQGFYFIKTRAFVHANCSKAKENRKYTCFTSLNAKFLEQLPAVILTQIPVCVLKRRLMDVQTVRFIREFKAVASFNALETISTVLQHSLYLQAMKCYYQQQVHDKNPTTITAYVDQYYHPFPTFQEWPGKILNCISCRLMYLNEMRRLEPLLSAHMVSLHGTFLKIDHTFKVTKYLRSQDGTTIYSTLLNVMNEYQEVIAYYFWNSKSLADLDVELKLLCNRLGKDNVKAIATDNPRSDSRKLKEIFGDDVHIPRDIFHVLQDLFRHCTATPLRSMFMGEVSEAFFTLDANDVNKLKEQLLGTGMHQSEHLDAMPGYWWREQGVRAYIVDIPMIEKQLECVFKRYRGKNLFKQSMLSCWDNMLDQLRCGRLTDPPNMVMHINVGSVQNPKYVTKRGTSQLESFHHAIQQCLQGPNGSMEIVHLLLVDRIFRWNMNKAQIFKKNDLAHSYDPSLFNDIMSLLCKLDIAPHSWPTLVRKWAPLEPYWNPDIGPVPHVHETFGATRICYASQTMQISHEESNFWDLSIQELGAEYNNYSNNNDDTLCDQQLALRMCVLQQPKHVATADEEDFFWEMLPQYMQQTIESTVLSQIDFENVRYNQMALAWNRCLLAAFRDDSDIIQLPPDIESTSDPQLYTIDNFTFKDASHLKIYAKTVLAPKIQCSMQQGDTTSIRRHFRTQRIQVLVDPSHPPAEAAPTINTERQTTTIQTDVCTVPIQIPTSTTHMQAVHIPVRQQASNSVRKEVGCPECKSPSVRRHKTGCLLNTYRKIRELQYAQGIVPRPPKPRSMSRFQQLMQEWILLSKEAQLQFILLNGHLLN